MAYPDYYSGDIVLIKSPGFHVEDRVSSKLEGKLGVVLHCLGPYLRAKGSKVSCAYYRVYVPELDAERSLKGHYLQLVERPLSEEEGIKLWKENIPRLKEKGHLELSGKWEEGKFKDFEDVIEFMKKHRRLFEEH